ncbi:hypothetical protein NGDEOPKE_00202 [Enterococcus phage vB_OCPT_Carl]|uniref:Uncharacterized protein n=1 Tax=Enterococcus phage vB_OCPT_Car TaxID=2922319 RepID=A0A9E7DUB9_9CAUD|nr:hypothetical protein NGDEOPKE_00202 [Enterococcus phage vB_OCPT_Carl]UQT00165.1 hypothetical protein EGEOBHOM_00006 [Enterococcus phage vB_OCPT_Car]
MTKENNVFLNEKGLLKEIIDTLENGFDGCYCDLFMEVFNYGVNAGIEDLEEYGIFNAIGEIQEYEKENFGEVLTDLGSPTAVADMLYYVKGHEFLYGRLDFNDVLADVVEELELDKDLWNENGSKQVNNAIIKCLKREVPWLVD